ncbi:hypothetical protein GJAV_G00049480 [Gymnothorax javanicus]|nr:hypothetical protein GJAV_G00049480 [Gymnothorax javanicus]
MAAEFYNRARMALGALRHADVPTCRGGLNICKRSSSRGVVRESQRGGDQNRFEKTRHNLPRAPTFSPYQQANNKLKTYSCPQCTWSWILCLMFCVFECESSPGPWSW